MRSMASSSASPIRSSSAEAALTDRPPEKTEKPAPAASVPADDDKPGSPGWVPGRPDQRTDRGRGPTCPYRLGF